MPHVQTQPAEAVEVVRRKPGPKPKKLRYSAAIQQAEDTLAGRLPELIKASLDLALTPGDHQPKALSYCINRILGMPAKLEKAPADDGGAPAGSLNQQTVEQLVLGELSDGALATLRQVISDDLIKHGKLEPGAEVVLNPTGDNPPPTTTKGPVPDNG